MMTTLTRCFAITCVSVASASAQGQAHQHGVARLDVAVEGPVVTLQLDSPLESLLGFERRPRTAAEREEAAAVLKQLDPGNHLWRPNAEAQCRLVRTTLVAPLLQTPALAGVKEDGHADLEAGWEFRCAAADKLVSVDHGLFDAFRRIQRIEVQVAGPGGQVKRALKRPDKRLSLKR